MSKQLLFANFDNTKGSMIVSPTAILNFLSRINHLRSTSGTDSKPIILASKKLSLESGVKITGGLIVNNDNNPYKAFLNSLSSIDPQTPELDVFLLSHGSVLGGKHVLEFSIDNYVNNSSFLKTSDLFSAMKAKLPNTKFNILMSSCYSGMAQCDVNLLPEGSVLYTTSDPSSSLAAAPIRNAFRSYPLHKDYDPKTIIELALLNRIEPNDSEEHVALGSIPHLIRDMVIKGVSGGEVLTYQISDLSKLDYSKVTGLIDVMHKLSNEGDTMYHTQPFSVDLLRVKDSAFDKAKVRSFIEHHDHDLSFIALETESTKSIVPRDFLKSVNIDVSRTLTLSFSEFKRVFLGSGGEDNIMDLIFMNHRSVCAIDKKDLDKTILMEGIKKSLEGQDIGHFATISIACDIISRHHTEYPEYVIRVGFIPTESLNVYELIEMVISEEEVNSILGGEMKNVYEFLKTKAQYSQSKIDRMGEGIARDIDDQVLLEELKELMAKFNVSKFEKLSQKPIDPLIKKICDALDKCVVKLAEAHEVFTHECYTDQELVDCWGHYLHEKKGVDCDIVQILGENGDVSASCDTTTL
ncbi:MAG: hypothetical protein RLZZ59_435 [Pseudomonadota bacterium]|jgi:hypothetical protein